MKINKAELQAALEKVRPGLASKDVIEQATSFAFIGGRVITYNDEISISCPVKGLEEITGAIKAQALYEFLNKVKKEEIELEWEDNQVIIHAGRSKAGLLFESEVKLPLDSEIGNAEKWGKLPEGIIEGLKLCYPCCSRDMSRPVLTCVHVNKDIIEASDSYQIIQYKLGKKIPGKGFLIPATSVKELIKYDIAEMSLGESWVHFRTKDMTVIFSARVIGDTFPDVSKYLQVEGTEFNFPDILKEALEKASVFTKKSLSAGDIPVVTIVVKEGLLKLSAKNEFGWFEEKMKIKNKDVNFSFSISIELLISLFEKLQTNVISSDKIGFTGKEWLHVISIMPNEEGE